MKLNSRFILGYNKYTNKKGEQSLFAAIKLPLRTEDWYIIIKGVKLEPRYWNETEDWVSRRHPNFKVYDAVLNKIQKDLDDMELDCIRNNMTVTKDMVKKYFKKGIDANWVSFNQYCRDILRKDRSLKKSTRQNLTSILDRHLDDYNDNISFWELNKKFGYDFITFLEGKKISDNTINKIVRGVNRFCTLAFKDGKIREHPFLVGNFKKARKTKDDFLTKEEINSIYDLELEKGTGLWRTKMKFLFACYTGLRHSDINSFRTNYIHGNILQMKAFKTEERLSFPIDRFFEGRALKIIEEGIKKPRNKFMFVDNQDDNKNLREIAEMVGIKRHLTFHISRHSFMTHMASVIRNQYQLMAYTGIKDPSTALRYIHFNEDMFLK